VCIAAFEGLPHQLLDDLVGPDKQSGWHSKAECLLIRFPSGEVLPRFNALAGIDFESLLLDTNGRFGRPT
jgi:hypothetical protein